MDLTNLNDIRELLTGAGFRFSRAMGQNFLISRWVPERIAAESRADKSTGVLEIGPGIGCLTRELAQRAGRVVAVELDKRLIPVLGTTLADCDNVTVLEGDVMRLDLNRLAAEHYRTLEKNASDCVQCGHCDSRCPFAVKQIERMQQIAEYFR